MNFCQAIQKLIIKPPLTSRKVSEKTSRSDDVLRPVQQCYPQRLTVVAQLKHETTKSFSNQKNPKQNDTTASK